ncbi:unnamed protein product [Lactuca saligna]|uniref:Uncharacterized protein n=1 Tax=Lactuca saligna TaxID=75948 RepID=A0AA35VM15_LACSI|nr:unnamed protein product [Lactuca saligna]
MENTSFLFCYCFSSQRVAIKKRRSLGTFSSVFFFLGCQSNNRRWLLFPVNIKEATTSCPFSSPCRLKLQNSHEITDPELLLLSFFFFTNFCQGTTKVVGCCIETKEGNSHLVLSCALTGQLNQPKPPPKVGIFLQSRRHQDLHVVVLAYCQTKKSNTPHRNYYRRPFFPFVSHCRSKKRAASLPLLFFFLRTNRAPEVLPSSLSLSHHQYIPWLPSFASHISGLMMTKMRTEVPFVSPPLYDWPPPPSHLLPPSISFPFARRMSR